MRSSYVSFFSGALISLSLAGIAVGCGSSGATSGPPGGHDASADVGADAAGDTATPTPDGGSDAGDAAPADAAPDVDNGAPSTNYPAPHPPMPQVINRSNGPVLATPKAYLIFYPGDPNETGLAAYAQSMTTSTYWTTTTHEYGVNSFAYGGLIELTGQTAPQTISSTDLETWVEQQIAMGTFGTPDPNAIYTIVFPSTTTITQPNPVSSIFPPSQSCVAFGGYHDNAQVTASTVVDGGATDAGPDGGAIQNYAYAIIPTCSTSIDDLTSVISHEWVEASTDPQVTASGAFTLTGGPSAAFYLPDQNHVIWALLGGGEVGDMCEPEGDPIYITPTDLGHQVQRTWSNLSAQGSHDPCVPGISGAFFDSAPVLTEMVNFNSQLTGSVTSQGVTIPMGQSKTIEVDLFSDGDTGGPWTVAAYDVLAEYYANYNLTPTLSFSWDRTQGVNGEKLHLTITVTAASPIAGAHAFMIVSKQGTRQAVWPGLVVE